MNTAAQSPSDHFKKTLNASKLVSTRNALVVIFSLQIIFSLAVRYFSYLGDNSEQTLQHLLAYFTAEDIAKGTEYHRAGFLSGLVAKFVSILLTVIFVFTPFSRKLEDFFTAKSKNFVTLCFYFLSVYFLIETIVSLPFSYYFGFVLEHRFGFSRMNNVEWMLLELKQIGLSFVIWIPLEIGALLLLKRFSKIWIYLVPMAAFSLTLLWIAVWPLVVTPIFYDYEPLPEGALKEKIIMLAETAKIDVENIYKINESRYSNHTNAYFTGWGNNKKIFLYDTLLNKHTDDEIISVLAHEIGHWQLNHSVKKVFLSSVLLFIGCIIALQIFNATRRENKIPLLHLYSPSTFPFILLLSSFISLVTDPVESAYSRACESDADAIALNLTNDAESFIESHKKMARENSTRLNPHPFTKNWHSHPTTLERIYMAEEFRKK